jgi:hypothetical protein
MHTSFIFVLLGVFITTGCSTIRDSLIVGTTSGMATGALIGASMNSKEKSQAALQGALIGGAISAVASFFIHKGIEKRDNKIRRETLFNLDKFGVDYPKNYSGEYSPTISSPVVDSQWIESQVQGKKLIEGHRVWIISEDPQWIPSNKSKKSEHK